MSSENNKKGGHSKKYKRSLAFFSVFREKKGTAISAATFVLHFHILLVHSHTNHIAYCTQNNKKDDNNDIF